MELKSIAACFAVEGAVLECRNFGSGHINETYRIRTDADKLYILQKINRYVFRHPEAVMENIIAVTEFLRAKDPDPRHTLQFLLAEGGNYWYVDDLGEYWRMYAYLEGFCLDQTESLQDLYQSALAFGRFQMLLSDFPAHTLHETIPHFHDTPDRFRQLRQSAEENKAGRMQAAQPELERVLHHEAMASTLQQLLDAGKLPLRVTHNDTKLNNVLLDPVTRQGICVLDLDTVMPGLSLCDFGDAVRFGAATAEEDTRDLDRMEMDLKAFRAYAGGFLEAAVTLTELEVEMLPFGPIVMTLELAARFLKDYLDGDLYFKTAYSEHNLIRARAQLKLAEDMIRKLPAMQQIVTAEYERIHS